MKPPAKHVYYAKARAQGQTEALRLLLIERGERIVKLTDILRAMLEPGYRDMTRVDTDEIEERARKVLGE